MPWEAKRWFWFAGLMFLGSLWALTYEPDNVQRRSIIETEMTDKPTIPLRRPGPGQTPADERQARALSPETAPAAPTATGDRKAAERNGDAGTPTQ